LGLNLYTKYRPTTFKKVVGQKNIITVLSNAIVQEKIHHAYLFQGNAGVGKTTLARIFGKAIRCTSKFGVEPCNKCIACLHWDENIEIDAASNRGIENMENLKRDLFYRPKYADKKIVILDEFHQLTLDSLSSLLKVVEEPPKHIVFIFCTTSKFLKEETKQEQALRTLMSRCIQLSLNKVSSDDMIEKFKSIWNSETKEIPGRQTQNIFYLLAKRSKGSVRDAENLLEMFLLQYLDDPDVSPEWLFPKEERRALELIQLLCSEKPLNALPFAQKIWEEGINIDGLGQYVREITSDIVYYQAGYPILRDEETRIQIEELGEIIQSRYLITIMNNFMSLSDNKNKLQESIINVIYS
jgi:DNA polymerase III subunit gamma/tau